MLSMFNQLLIEPMDASTLEDFTIVGVTNIIIIIIIISCSSSSSSSSSSSGSGSGSGSGIGIGIGNNLFISY